MADGRIQRRTPASVQRSGQRPSIRCVEACAGGSERIRECFQQQHGKRARPGAVVQTRRRIAPTFHSRDTESLGRGLAVMPRDGSLNAQRVLPDIERAAFCGRMPQQECLQCARTGRIVRGTREDRRSKQERQCAFRIGMRVANDICDYDIARIRFMGWH